MVAGPMGPIKYDILTYCYNHQRLVTISEIEAIVPVPLMARDYVLSLIDLQYLEPIENDQTRITAKGISEVDDNLKA